MGGYDFVRDRLSKLRERVAAAALRAGRGADEIGILAVTKFQPEAAVLAAWDAGLRAFGENRVQEAELKYPLFLASHPGARLDLIGHLQSNKARRAIGLFSRIESVDSIELVAELDRRCRQAGTRIELLLELHTGEDSKSGFPSLEELFAACELLAQLAAKEGAVLLPRGLMTMAPYTKEDGPVRASFRALREALGQLRSRFAFERFEELSMGMSDDFETAIEEGSTLIRIGTAIFGERVP